MARRSTAAAENSGETGDKTPPVGRRFEAGKSGNPGGRPKGVARRAREIAGDDGETALLVLGTIMADSKERTGDRIRATEILLERGWGKAPVFAPIEDGDPLELAEDAAEVIALDFDRTIDELAERRGKAAADAKRGKVAPPAPPKKRTPTRKRKAAEA
jgi:hypothetical protein